MSNGLQIRALTTAIADAVQAAWGEIKVEVGEPTQLIDPPYAVITWGKVTVDFQTALQNEQTYTFTIAGRFDWPALSTDKLAFVQSDRADELIAQLQTAATFATWFYLPIVQEIRFTEDVDEQNGRYAIELDFTVCAAVDHH